MRYTLFVLLALTIFSVHAQVIWSADPNESTNVNDFFRRFDGGNYPTDYCYSVGDEAGVTPSSVSTETDPVYGKVWKVNKPKNRKRGEFARTEGDVEYYAPKEGDDIYIGWRWKVDREDGGDITSGVAVWQWKSAGAHDQNYPMSMYYDGELTLNAYGPDYANNSSQSSMRTVLWRKTIPQDTWVTFVVRVKVDRDDFGGLVEFWFNGEKQKLTNEDFNKYQVNLSADKYTAYHRTNDGDGVYPKWGIYNKNSCAINANAYFHDMKIGYDVSDVMPSGNTPNQSPAGSFTLPLVDQLDEGYSDLHVQVDASDADGTIANVLLKIDGNAVRTESNPPYDWGHSNSPDPNETVGLSAGDHLLEAIITDDQGATTTIKKTITVNRVNNAPSIEIVSPMEGQVFIVGDDITITALATDDIEVDRVNFKLDGGYHSQDQTGDNGAYTTTYSFTAPGFYELGARAFDNEGESVEETVTIEVRLITGSEEITEDEFKLYPIPARDVIFLNAVADWELVSISGLTQKVGTGNKIEVSDVENGYYLVNINNSVYKVIIE